MMKPEALQEVASLAEADTQESYDQVLHDDYDTAFEAAIRDAARSLNDALAIAEALDDEDYEAPGKGYLLARLELALDILEAELPEVIEAESAAIYAKLTEVIRKAGVRLA